jgi:hypothetical protein
VRPVGSLRRRAGLGMRAGHDLAWLAGLLEGEGYFGLIKNHVAGKIYRYARIGVTMTDEDVIARAAQVLGARYWPVKPSGLGRKMQHRCEVRGQRAVAWMRTLQPLMGERRRGQIDRVFAHEAMRHDPSEARRRWSRRAAAGRERSANGRFRAAA